MAVPAVPEVSDPAMSQSHSGQDQHTGNENCDNHDSLSNKERRRRERRERRARRQRRQNQLLNQMDNYMYEGACFPGSNTGDASHIPDILNNQNIPPPAYSTLPGHGQTRMYPPPPPGCWPNPPPPPLPPHTSQPRSWRASLSGFTRRSRRNNNNGGINGETFLMPPEVGESKSCCGIAVSQTVSIRWFIVMIAFVGICCAIVGTVLGAMKASGREHLTVSLLMIGVGIVLITVSGIAWRLTSQDAPSCCAMLGLAPYPECGDGRFLNRSRAGAGPVGATHPYAGMMYSEFQYRPPPPTYQASMQEYRLRLLLMDRSAPPPPPVVSPPPAYRGPPPPNNHGSIVSRPPSYRSYVSDHIIPVHGRQSSQLSFLSFAGAPETVLEHAEIEAEGQSKEVCNPHASVVSVIPGSQNKASIRIQGSDIEQYISNIQDQITKLDTISSKSNKTDSKGKASGKKSAKKQKKDNEQVTIVQNSGQSASGDNTNEYPVVVTVSGSVPTTPNRSQQTQAEVDILAHL